MSWRDDLNWGLAAFGVHIPDHVPSLDSLAAQLGNDPCRKAVNLVAISSVIFYLAERGRNPKVNTIWDAMVYCSTCLSVGYADIFPRTPVGKMIGSFIMTIGPSLSARVLDGPAHARADVAHQEQTLDMLKKIVAHLESPPDDIARQ